MLKEERDGREQCGIGVLSRFSIEVVKSELLTAAGTGRLSEARGAIWVKIGIDGGKRVNLINIDFGLRRNEPITQKDELMGDDWIGAVPENEPVVCGDFNLAASSAVMKRLRPRLRDFQQSLTTHQLNAAFSGPLPLWRLDHIFVSRHFDVREVELADTSPARLASDHRPVCGQLRLSVSR